MEWLTKMITQINGVVNDFVWGPVMLVVFLAVGLMFTIRTGFFQITHIKLWMTETFISIFKKKDVRRTKDQTSISQFQALATALAATVGTGNIARRSDSNCPGRTRRNFLDVAVCIFRDDDKFCRKYAGDSLSLP